LLAIFVNSVAVALPAQDVVPRPTSVGGCPAEPLAFHKCALEKVRTFSPPRTPDGRPNLQGYWIGVLANPFSVEGVREDDPMVGNPVMPWTVEPPMIVDPADRRIPYQPWAVAIGRKGINHDKYIDPRTACATGGVPRLALQDASQILQPSGGTHVLWMHDDHRAYRVIAMNGPPAQPGTIKLWNGESYGRWEGNTLVIDTRNFNGFTWLDDSGDFYTDAAHLLERLTMVDRNTIHYAVTLEDPKVYTRPWTMAWAQVRVTEPGFERIEESCLEGERNLPGIRELGYRFYFGAPWRAR
jgi:hypothetical protein